MSIGPAYLARVFPDPWPHELSLATAGGPDAIDCVTDRMADAGLVRRRETAGSSSPGTRPMRESIVGGRKRVGLNESTQSPLVSAEVDLRDFPFMPLDVVRPARQRADREGDWGRVQGRGAALVRFVAPAPSGKPSRRRRRAERTCAATAALRRSGRRSARARRGWVKCSDGRLYHPTVAEKAREAWQSKVTTCSHRGCEGRREEARQRQSQAQSQSLSQTPKVSVTEDVTEQGQGQDRDRDRDRDRTGTGLVYLRGRRGQSRAALRAFRPTGNPTSTTWHSPEPSAWSTAGQRQRRNGSATSGPPRAARTLRSSTGRPLGATGPACRGAGPNDARVYRVGSTTQPPARHRGRNRRVGDEWLRQEAAKDAAQHAQEALRAPHDKPAFVELLTQALGFYGQAVSPFAVSVWWQACQGVELDQVRRALTAHAMDPDRGHFAPKPADVVRQLSALRPTAA